MLLLNDETGPGAEVKEIASKYSEDHEEIVLDIVCQWIKGRGQPVSWNVLIEVLKLSGLRTLASQIEYGLNN